MLLIFDKKFDSRFIDSIIAVCISVYIYIYIYTSYVCKQNLIYKFAVILIIVTLNKVFKDNNRNML